MKKVHDDSEIYDEVGEVAKANFEVTENTCYEVTNSQINSATIDRKNLSHKKAILLLFVLMTALLLCTVSACIGFAARILELQSETKRLSILRSEFDSLKQEIALDANGTEQEFSTEMLYLNLSRSHSALEIKLDMLKEDSIQNYSEYVASLGEQKISIHILTQLLSSLENRTRLIESTTTIHSS